MRILSLYDGYTKYGMCPKKGQVKVSKRQGYKALGNGNRTYFERYTMSDRLIGLSVFFGIVLSFVLLAGFMLYLDYKTRAKAINTIHALIECEVKKLQKGQGSDELLPAAQAVIQQSLKQKASGPDG